ncbi:hypothetical protein ABZY57_04455 [Streptomyces sp. NPDC006450]
MIWAGLYDFLVHDVLGNTTATVLLAASTWTIRKIKAARTRRDDQTETTT